MFINRRLYVFTPIGKDGRQGILKVGEHSGMVEKTGNTKTETLRVETMTGSKMVKQYYDEFTGLEKDYDLTGDADHPQWIRREEIKKTLP